MNKKIIAISAMLLCFVGVVFAQQITRFAVVDTAAIFDTFRRDSKAARSYEEKQAKYSEKTKELSDEIVKLRQKKVDAVAAGKESNAKKYEEQIKSKTVFLQEYVKACNDELAVLKKDLMSDDEFYSSLYRAIQRVAETEGYSMVMTLQQGSGIIWYSPTVDITSKIIQELKK